MTRVAFIAFVLLGLGWSGCSRQSSMGNTTLPSGKQIRITSTTPMHFPNGENALILNCETDIPVTDMVNLRKEVDEIWATFFQKEVERANMTTGVIRISHAEGGGLITHSQGYGFGFEKRPDGQWHCVEDDQK